MFDVICDGRVIARASTAQEARIYTSCYFGVNDEEIAESLHIPLASVKRLTQGGSSR